MTTPALASSRMLRPRSAATLLLAPAVAAVVLAVLPVEARAQAPGEYLGPREIALGESMRADARGALATTLNPAGVALGSELVFEGSYGRGFADDSNAISVSGCDATVATPGCFYYRYFKASPEVGGATLGRRVHEGGATLAKDLARLVMLGATIKYFDYDSDLAGEGDTSGFTLDVGGVVRPVEGVALGVTGHHIIGKDSPQYPRLVGAGLSVRPIPSLSLSFDGLWDLDAPDGETTGRYGGGAEFFLSQASSQIGYPLRGGLVYDAAGEAMYVTGGLGMLQPKLGLDVGLRKQVRGGDELLVVASLRIFGPRRVAGSNRFAY